MRSNYTKGSEAVRQLRADTRSVDTISTPEQCGHRPNNSPTFGPHYLPLPPQTVPCAVFFAVKLALNFEHTPIGFP